MMPRNVAARTDMVGEALVIGGLADELAIAAVGEARAGIARHQVDDAAVTAIDQNLGDGFAQGAPPRDRPKVALAFGAGILDQIRLRQLLRAHQHRGCDRNGIVEGEGPHHLLRRVGTLRQPAGQLRLCVDLDRFNQNHQDIVEQRELLVRVPSRAGEEQVGHARECIEPHRGRALRNGQFEILNQGGRSGHGIFRHASGSGVLHWQPSATHGIFPGSIRAMLERFLW